MRSVALLLLLAACAGSVTEPAVTPPGLRIAPNCASIWQIQVDTAQLGLSWFPSASDTLWLPAVPAGAHAIYAVEVSATGWALGHDAQSVTAPAVVTLHCI